MILRHSFVVLQADQDKHCMHFPIFLHSISNIDTQMYDTNYAMFAGPIKYFCTLHKIPTDFDTLFLIYCVCSNHFN